MDPLSGAASVAAVVQITAQIFSLCRDYYSEVKSARSDIDRLSSEIQAFQHVLQQLQKLAESSAPSSLPASTLVLGDLSICMSDLRTLEVKLESNVKQKRMRKMGLRALKWPFASHEFVKIITTLERHKATFNTALGLDQMSLELSEKRERNLSRILAVEGATFKSYRPDDDRQCLENTRVDLLDQLLRWSTEPHNQCIFWLRGMAGTGKSTIARTIANTFAVKHRLGASFFFTRGGGDLGRATKFFSSVALQLARLSPVLKKYIADAVEKQDDISQQSLREQWKHLILEPLERLEKHQGQLADLILVIDALDECDNDRDIRNIIQLLSQVQDLKKTRLRLVVTSRPEISIRLGFQSLPEVFYHNLALENVPQEVVESDISIFLRNELRLIGSEHRLPASWPAETDVQILTKKAGRLFIYAATVCRFVASRRSDPQERLSKVLSGSNSGSIGTKELDSIYTRVVKSCIDPGEDESEQNIQQERFRFVVGSIVVLFAPLSSAALASLLALGQAELDPTLNYLHSVLRIPESPDGLITLLHPSFRDFLLDNGRCSEAAFRIDGQRAHFTLALQCLRVMLLDLKRDMCDLQRPGTLAEELSSEDVTRHLPPHLQYACCYWVDHLKEAGKSYWEELGLHDEGAVYTFFQKSFLCWLECMSLIGKTSKALLDLTSLEASIKEHGSNNALLSAAAYDGRRFLLEFKVAIVAAPLQLYYSALTFSPKTSVTRKTYLGKGQRGAHLIAAGDENWNSCLQTLEGPTGVVISVAFSPDDQLIASCSYDATVSIWDVMTATLLYVLRHHTSLVGAVTWTCDGKYVVSGSRDATVQIWDVANERSLHQPLRHESEVKSVATTRDGLLASLTSLLRIWDIKEGTLLRTLDIGQPGRSIVVCSSKNTILVATNHEHLLCDMTEGNIIHKFSSPLLRSSMALSKDGRRAASASKDALHVWDTTTGTPLQETQVDSGVNSHLIGFYNFGLLSWSFGHKTVKIEDATTGERLCRLEGHTQGVWSVAIAHNEKLIATGSWDKTLKIWDLQASKTAAHDPDNETLDGVIEAVSYDGRLAAMRIYGESTIRVLYTDTGLQKHQLYSKRRYIFNACFSWDAALLAIASNDRPNTGCEIRLVNMKTGDVSYSFDVGGHDLANFLKMALSHDGQLLACGFMPPTVCIWDIGLKEWVLVLKKPDGYNTRGPEGLKEFLESGDTQLGNYRTRFQYPSPPTVYGLSDDEKWVTRRGHNYLWLPANVRPHRYSIHGNRITLGAYGGRSTVLELEDEDIDEYEDDDGYDHDDGNNEEHDDDDDDDDDD